jgi:hypothetical protein
MVVPFLVHIVDEVYVKGVITRGTDTGPGGQIVAVAGETGMRETGAA